MTLRWLPFKRTARLPIITVGEMAECGLAAVTMVARYHGHNVDLTGVRKRFGLSSSGATLRVLIDVSAALGLAARPLSVDLDDLTRLQLPAIAHWDFNHFVVLAQVRGQTIILHDPARGRIKLTLADFSNHFTGVILELEPIEGVSRLNDRGRISLRSVWSGATFVPTSVTQILAFTVIIQLATLLAPLQVQLAVDHAITRDNSTLLASIALGFAGIALVQCTLEALRSWSIQLLSNKLTFQMVSNVVNHLLRLPISFFEKRSLADIMSRIDSTRSIQEVVTRGSVTAVVDGVMATLSLAVITYYSTTLALIVTVSLVLSLYLTVRIYPSVHTRTQSQMIASTIVQSHTMETVRAASTIRLMGAAAVREGEWRNLYVRLLNTTTALWKYQIISIWSQTLLTALTVVGVVYVGGLLVISGEKLSVGMLLAVLSYRQTLSDRTNSLINQAIQFRLLGIHLERLADILSSPKEAVDATNEFRAVDGEIELRNVSFRYGAGDRWLFRNLDLHIRAGEFVALYGPSGSGKTTLMKLMLGLLVPTEGDVLIDGSVATAAAWHAWRKMVGVVEQDDRLLSGSLLQNITFFDPDADQQRAEAAARAAQIDADIQRMPMKYSSLVGDMGSNLSGGQRQRVFLARALYRQPRVLFLDEGTAHLDDAAERAIGSVLDEMPITRIVVAHRAAIANLAMRQIKLGADGSLTDQPAIG